MKNLLFAMTAGLVLTAQPIQADDPAMPRIQLPPVHLGQPVQRENPTVPAEQPLPAENSATPDAGFPASRYEALWTKSPFAVATSEEVQKSSPDYMLVGIAKIDGISYASVIEARPPQEHFLISTDKPTRGLTLTSITRNHDDTYAVVQKDGESLTLKLEQPPAMTPAPGAPPINMVGPGVMTPQIPMPGANLPTTGSTRPFLPPARFHRSTIHMPLPPTPQQQPAPPPPR